MVFNNELQVQRDEKTQLMDAFPAINNTDPSFLHLHRIRRVFSKTLHGKIMVFYVFSFFFLPYGFTGKLNMFPNTGNFPDGHGIDW